jgi:photosystem II stability/assembly factor-like uncharacterized protein
MRQDNASVPPTAAIAEAAPSPPAAPSLQETISAEAALKGEAQSGGGVASAREAPADRDRAGLLERRSDSPNQPATVQDGLARLQTARLLASRDVVSPDAQIRWQVGPGSSVQHSADGGATWVTQQTGAPAALTAGSAPATDVLWIVGRQGVVLRTTDRGRQWQRVPFPETADLIAITAASARNATVALADGRRFATDDGGVTWGPAR